MAILMSSVVVYAAVLAVLLAANNVNSIEDDDPRYCTCNAASINRRGFPEGFIFGSSSSAYQVEGAYNVNGKGFSIWDNFTHTYPEKILDHSNGDVAIDSYHLYKEDVRILKDMGLDAYRFSISWSRILPGGVLSGGVNQDGVDYYNNLINELLANGIEPWITILHLDYPQALQDAYGGFLSSQIVSDFQDFSEILFSTFGDRVKNWITINEPWGFSYLSYTWGVMAPGRCSLSVDNSCVGGDSSIEPYKVMHNQLLAHAAVVNLYNSKFKEKQKGKIGIVVNSFWFVPYDETNKGMKTRDRAFDFMLGWVMDPITFGRYPETMRRRVGERLPEFTKEEAEMVKGPLDFVGLNYYSAKYAVNLEQPSDGRVSYITDSGYFASGDKDGIPIGEQGSNKSSYNTFPKGLRLILQHMKIKYKDPVIYITENGLDEDTNDSVPMSEAIEDYKRKKYFFNHLCCLHEAIEKDGANVKGYFAWSLTNNYNFAKGYFVQFGIYYVDFIDKSFRRYPKLSAKWLKSILSRTRGVSQTRRVSDH